MNLLKHLYKIYSPSGNENAMVDFLEVYCEKAGASVVRDEYCLYVAKGTSDTYPCIVAHTDQVQKNPCRAYQVEDILLGLSLDGESFEGLGADDKNGIWIALKCLETFPAIKLVFFNDEERGCIGSSHANISFFDNCRFVIECDRRGGRDFITEIMSVQICSDEFIADAGLKHYGFREAQGMITDVYQLLHLGLRLSCCNIFCGYYEPHTEREYTKVSELENTLSFVKNILTNCTRVYHFKPELIEGITLHELRLRRRQL